MEGEKFHSTHNFNGGVMGYRILVVAASLALLASCAAFDSSNTPYEGFSPDEIPVPQGVGIYSGHYAGTKTLDSSTCASVSDELGDQVPLEFDVEHRDTAVNVVFGENGVAAGTLSGESATVMTTEGNAKNVYYLTFATGRISGSAEVIEADAAGQYGDACASYTLTMTKEAAE